jgi:two-component system phosphate regulon sensor histidine kinase PhoR
MLEDEPALSDNGRRSLQTAQRQAERMKELIQDQLLLSQAESYQLSPGEGDRISVTDLMTDMMAALDKYEDHDRIDLDYPHELFLLGLRVELEGICINLVENALKYTTPGTSIDVSWQENANAEYVFRVADQGPGIEAEDVDNITRRYYRGRKVRSEVTGSGLGLAIVQHAAGKHGATIDIESTPGKGSCFCITFPSYRCLHEDRKVADVMQLSDY